MKKAFKTLLIGSAIAGISLSYNAANAITESNDATVTIVTPLTVTASDDMDFGKLVSPASGSVTSIVDTSGNLTGTATFVGGTTGSSGTVTISGTTGETVAITITDTTGTTGLGLSNFTGSFGGQSLSGDTLTGANVTSTPTAMKIGATLTVDSTVSAGTYTPTYDVEVSYN